MYMNQKLISSIWSYYQIFVIVLEEKKTSDSLMYILVFGVLFVWVDALCHIQQFFSHFGMFQS